MTFRLSEFQEPEQGRRRPVGSPAATAATIRRKQCRPGFEDNTECNRGNKEAAAATRRFECGHAWRKARALRIGWQAAQIDAGGQCREAADFPS